MTYSGKHLKLLKKRGREVKGLYFKLSLVSEMEENFK